MADRYCTECGMALGPDDKFCPGCGAEMKDLDDYSAPAAQADAPKAYGAPYSGSGEMASRLRILGVLTLIWGIIALMAGVSVLISVDSTVNSMIEQFVNTESPVTGYANMWDYLVASGITADLFKTLLWVVGGTFAVSGVSGLISGFLMLKRSNYTIAMAMLLISTITAILGIITLIIGIIVFVMFTKTKGEFTS